MRKTFRASLLFSALLLGSAGMAMAQGHALAPWRPIAVRQRAIPCPECQRMSLVQMGGMDVVTCRTVRCGATLEPDEFVRWVEACTDRDEVGA